VEQIKTELDEKGGFQEKPGISSRILQLATKDVDLKDTWYSLKIIEKRYEEGGR